MSFGKEIPVCVRLEVKWGSCDFIVLREKQVHGGVFLLPKVTRSWSVVVSLFLKEVVPGLLREKDVKYLREKDKQDKCKRSRY